MERMKPNILLNWVKQNDMSQEAFARACGVGLPFMHKLLHGKGTDIANSLLRRISEATGLDIDAVSEELFNCTEHNKELNEEER